MNFDIDWDKVKSFDDLKRIVKSFQFGYSEYSPLEDVSDLLVETIEIEGNSMGKSKC